MAAAVQLDLFDAPPTIQPRARRSDPETSKIAAAEIVGGAQSLRRFILALIEKHPGLTVGELSETPEAVARGINHVQIGKRIPELYGACAIDHCGKRRWKNRLQRCWELRRAM